MLIPPKDVGVVPSLSVKGVPAGTAYTNSAGTSPTSVGGIDFYSISTNNQYWIDDLCYGEGFIGN